MNAIVTRIRTEAEAEIERLYQARGLPALHDAWQIFEAAGLPHRRIEAWHYTDLRARMRHVLPLAPKPDKAALDALRAAAVLEDIDGYRLVFVDGHFIAALSSSELPQGVSLSTQVEAAAVAPLPAEAANEAMLALNSALLQGAAILTLTEGVQQEKPLHIVSLVTHARHTSVNRVVVHARAGAKATIIETFLNADAEAQRHSSILFDIGDKADVLHVARQIGEGQATTHIATLVATLRERSKFESYAVTAGGALTRRQIFARFDGEHAELSLWGASVLRGEQHADTTLVVDHASAHCVSRERFKHIVDEDATGVFQGKIIVRPGAQKTDGAMKSDTILLSDGAVMNNKPELEIFADDVVCGHGATCDYLDEDQLFYLMARGLPRSQAESLLLDAFAGEVLDTIEDEPLHDLMRGHLHDWFDAREVGE